MIDRNSKSLPNKRTLSRSTGLPTLADVSKLAGVSAITASRALRGISTVDPVLAHKVKDAAKALGYVANPAARALASANSQTVVVIVPSLSNHLFIEALEAIHGVLRPHGLEILIGTSHYSTSEEVDLLRNYLTKQPNGIILTGFERSAVANELISGSGIPVVHMMELDDTPGVICTGLSHEEAGAAVGRHLLASGRRRLAYVASQMDSRVIQRRTGFRRALLEAGLNDPPFEVTAPGQSSVALGRELFRQLIEEHPDVDGIFFCNDDLAHGTIFEAARRGIDIPQQIALVGYNDLPISSHMIPSLSSVHTPLAQIGKSAAEQLLCLINKENVPNPRIDVGFELIIRESG